MRKSLKLSKQQKENITNLYGQFKTLEDEYVKSKNVLEREFDKLVASILENHLPLRTKFKSTRYDDDPTATYVVLRHFIPIYLKNKNWFSNLPKRYLEANAAFKYKKLDKRGHPNGLTKQMELRDFKKLCKIVE